MYKTYANKRLHTTIQNPILLIIMSANARAKKT